jgi:hypothetical protein
MAYIYNSTGMILGSTTTTTSIGNTQLGFYDLTSPNLIVSTLGFERLVPAQLVTNICQRTAYIIRLSLNTYLGNNFTVVTDRRLASPFTILTTLNGRVVFDSPFRASLSGQIGNYTLERDLNNYATVGYSGPLPTSLSSCLTCGCPSGFACGTDGSCYYSPNPCNGICRGNCYGICPSGSFCNQASNGLYGCVSDIGNSWFWFWLFFLIFIVLLITIIMVISAASSKNAKTSQLLKMSSASSDVGCGRNSSISESIDVLQAEPCVIEYP